MKQLTMTIIFFLFYLSGSAQNTDSLKLKNSDLNQIQSLLDYYETYENNTSEKEKKDALNEFIDDTGATITDKEREDVFKVVDFYINADQDNSKQSMDKKIDIHEKSEIEKDAEKHFNDAKSQLMNMSYPEYSEFIKNASPLYTEKEIKESYNALHKNDGKQIKILAGDNEKTKAMKQVEAFNILENPKNYQEFRDAIMVLNPNTKEEEIRKAWNNRDKN